MTKALKDIVDKMESYLPELERQRSSNPFANDVFEAADDLRHLCSRVLDGDTRVNYPVRAREELGLWRTLADFLQRRSTEEQQRYATIFETAQQILKDVQTVEPPKDGHLGVLRIIREQFGFVQTDYGFAIVKEEPIGIRFSSREVYLELEWAKKYNSSCSFGPESNPKESFWIDDLLFMHGDERYRNLPQDLALNSESDVQNWFKFLAGVFKQYGHDVLSNRPGIFERLAKAQTQRDQEYTQEMDRLYGHR
jgi:hypothetical protein